MKTPDIHTARNPQEVAQALARALAAEYLDTKRPLLLLFSGGSALTVLDFLPPWTDASCVTLSVVDERADPSGKESNFQALKRTAWFMQMVAAGATFLDPLHPAGVSPTTPLSPQEQAAAFEQALRKWRRQHPHPAGAIVTLLGMGIDGHTAGIFPFRDPRIFAELFCGEAWVKAHTVPQATSSPERITATLSFLQQEVERVYVFLCGQEKETVWKKFLAHSHTSQAPHALPLTLLYQVRHADIFTDLPALPASS